MWHLQEGGRVGTSICMHIRYVLHKRPPFSALNFHSRAYYFLKWQKYSTQEHYHFTFLPFRRPSLSEFLYVQAVHCCPQPAYCSQPGRKEFGQCPGVSGQPECQPDASYSQFLDPYFHARARSGAPHFSLCCGTYLPKFGCECPPPPPPASLMPSSQLPWTPCDKFVYDFPCDFWGIVGGYGVCVHIVYGHRAILFYGALGATRGKSVQRLCGDCTEIVQCQCSCCAVSVASAWKLYGARAGIGLHTVPVRGLCNATYDMSTGYRLTIFFKFVKLLAKPTRRGRGARESVRKSHSRLLPPQGGLTEAARKGGYGKDTGSVDPSQAKCELGISKGPLQLES